MRRGTWFWGLILILVGGVVLLGNMGLLGGFNPWNLIWPLVLIAFGIYVLTGPRRRGRAPVSEHVVIPLEGAERAKIKFQYGAGRLQLGAGAGSADLIEGSFSSGVEHASDRVGDRLELTLRLPFSGFPEVMMPWNWGGGTSNDWTCKLNQQVPLELVLETGASDADIDLRELKVESLNFKTGASSSRVRMPSGAGYTRAKLSAGAASMSIDVPEGVAARIRTQGGLAKIEVDQSRFPRSGGVYESADYETASNKVEIDAEAGIGSITVR